jgi:hypothetical protein
MAIKKTTPRGINKTTPRGGPGAKMTVARGKASRPQARTISVDPSSAVSKITAAKKKMTSGDATTDYEVSRAADAYAKALKKYGVKITPASWNYYKPKSTDTKKSGK